MKTVKYNSNTHTAHIVMMFGTVIRIITIGILTY